MKKTSVLLAALLAGLLVLSGCSSKTTTSSGNAGFTFGQVTDSGGVTDKSFNQGTYEGLTKFSKENGGSEPKYLTSKTAAEMEPNIKKLAEELDVVVTSGFTFEAPIINVAKTLEDKKFVLIDGTNGTEYSKNTANFSFAEQEAGYLAGVAAAKSTKTKKVGFIGGMEIPPVQKFGWGFIQGVADTDDTIEITYNYTGTFSDTALGKSTAQSMYASGTDIIFACAGQVGVGVINEAKEQRTKGNEVFVVGVDKDQYEDGKYDGDKSVILTSAVKGVDIVAYEAMKLIKDGKFDEIGGKTTVKTVKDGAVGLPSTNPNLSDDATKAADEATQAIKDGKITPPDTKDKVKVTNKINGKY